MTKVKTRKHDKRRKAQELLAKRATRTNRQQLGLLDLRFGRDKGATRERARLQRLIDKEAK